jgi:hypothetical protein
MDVARTMIALMTKKCFGERYILIENNYTFHNILSHIQNCMNRPAPTINASPAMLSLARFFEGFAYFFTSKPRKITKALIHSAFNKQLFSNQKIKKTLGIEFIPTHRAIEEICGFYLLRKANVRSSV